MAVARRSEIKKIENVLEWRDPSVTDCAQSRSAKVFCGAHRFVPHLSERQCYPRHTCKSS